MAKLEATLRVARIRMFASFMQNFRQNQYDDLHPRDAAIRKINNDK